MASARVREYRPLSAGDLKNRVTFQEPSGSTESGYITVLANVPAKVEALAGSEALRFGGQSAQNHVRVTIRFRTDIKPHWRMVDEYNRSLQIVNRNPIERLWLEIIAVELQE